MNDKLTVVKTSSLVEEAGSDVLSMVLTDLIPKLKPMMGGVIKKIPEMLQDGRYIAILRMNKGRSPKVIIIDTTKEFNIASSGIFEAEPDAVVNVFDITDFMEKIMSGEFNFLNK